MVRKCLRKCNNCGETRIIANGSHKIWNSALKKTIYCGTFRVHREPVVIKRESK